MIRENSKKILALLVTILMFSSLSGCNPIARALHNRTAGKTETAGDSGKKDLIEEKAVTSAINKEENTCLMNLYLNEDDEVVYGYEQYIP